MPDVTPIYDFTAGALTELAKLTGTRPVTILEARFATGTVFFSDHAFTVSAWDGSDRTVSAWIAQWGKVDDVADLALSVTPAMDGDLSLRVAVPGGRDGALTLWEKLTDRTNKPEQTVVSLYLWWKDLTASADPPVKRWEGTLGDYRWLDEQTLEVRLVDTAERLDRPAGLPLTTANWPNAHRDDVGKLEPIVYGSLLRLPCLRVDAGAVSAVSVDMTAAQTILYYSDVDYANFPASGNGFVDAEEISWTGKTTEVLNGVTHGKLTGLTRGVNSTTAAIHNKGTTLLEKKTNAVFLAAGHACKAIAKVYARRPGEEPTLQPGTAYTVELANTSAVDGHAAAVIKFTAYPSLPDKVNASTSDTIGVSDTIGGTIDSKAEIASQDTTTGLPASANFTNTSGADSATQISLSFNAPGGSPNEYEYDLIIYVSGSQSNGDHVWVKHNGTGKVIIAYYDSGVWSTFPHYFQSSASNTLEIGHRAGFDSGSYTVVQARRKVRGTGAFTKTGAATKTGTATTHIGNVIAQTWVGVEVLADVDGHKDDGSGTYTGVADVLIQNSRDVIKHFLVTYMGLAIADFKTSTGIADRMGTTYQLNGCVREPAWAKDIAARLAFESGCWLKFLAGRAWLIFRERLRGPDHIITTHRLAFLQDGRQTLDAERLPIAAVVNEINARYDRDWALPRGADAYRQISRAVDAASQTRYGKLFNDDLFLLDFVRTTAHAEALRDLYLSFYAERRQMVRFRTQQQHAAVNFGDHVRVQDRMDPWVTGEIVSVDFEPGSAVGQRPPTFDFTVLDIEEAEAMLAVRDSTVNYTLVTPADCEALFTNKGAPGTITFTLPAATRGQRFIFYRHDAQNIRIDPNGTEIFVLTFTSGSATDKTAPVAQAAGKYLEGSSARALLEVVCCTTGEWLVRRNFGTWTIEP